MSTARSDPFQLLRTALEETGFGDVVEFANSAASAVDRDGISLDDLVSALEQSVVVPMRATAEARLMLAQRVTPEAVLPAWADATSAIDSAMRISLDPEAAEGLLAEANRLASLLAELRRISADPDR